MTTYLFIDVKHKRPTSNETRNTTEQVVSVVPSSEFNDVSHFYKPLVGFVLLLIVLKKCPKLILSSNSTSTAPIVEIPNASTSYLIVVIVIFCSVVSFYLLIRIISFPFVKIYRAFDNTITWIGDTNNSVIKRFTLLFSSINNILYFLINPHIVSSNTLAQAQTLLDTKQEILIYFQNALALNTLAKEHGIYLTINNNGSFTVYPNKSVMIDKWVTAHIQEVVINRIASASVKKPSSFFTFPVVEAFNETRFAFVKQGARERLQIIYNDLNFNFTTFTPYFKALSFLNQTVSFLNRTGPRDFVVSTIVLIINQPVTFLVRRTFHFSALKIPVLLKKPNFGLTLKNKLGGLIPGPLRKFRSLFKPISDIGVMKKLILNHIAQKNSWLHYGFSLLLDRIPDSYLELSLLVIYYIIINRYVQYGLNLLAIRFVKILDIQLQRKLESISLYQSNWEHSCNISGIK